MYKLMDIIGGILLIPTTGIFLALLYGSYLTMHGLSLDFIYTLAGIGYPLFCLWFLLINKRCFSCVSDIPKYILMGIVLGILETFYLVFKLGSELTENGSSDVIGSIVVSFYMFYPLILVTSLILRIQYSKNNDNPTK